MNPEENVQKQEKPAEEKPISPVQGDSRRRHGSRRPRFKRDNRGGDRGGDRGPRPDRGGPPRPIEDLQRKPAGVGIRRAIEQVDQIRVELKKVLEDMYEVLRSLEQIEREKGASEEEIEMLRESLRLLHRDQGQFRNPRNFPQPQQPPAPPHSQPQGQAPTDPEDEPEESEHPHESQDDRVDDRI